MTFKLVERGLRPRVIKLISQSQVEFKIDYLSLLRKDYRALEILAKKFNRVSILYRDMMEEINGILVRYQELLSDSSSNPTSSTPPPVISTNSTEGTQSDEFLNALMRYVQLVSQQSLPQTNL